MLKYKHSRVVQSSRLADGREQVSRCEVPEGEKIGSADERLATFACTECGAEVVGRLLGIAFDAKCPHCGK